MSTKHYDIVVIGSGPGGYVAALKAAQMGASCAIVEKAELGGTCLNNGCIPSKALLAPGELLHGIRHQAKTLGVTIDGEVGFDWPTIQKHKDRVIRGLRGGIKGLFKARGVDLHQGAGEIVDASTVAVTDAKGTRTELGATNIIIATGSTPATIPGWPDDPEKVATSDHGLHWKTLPKRLVIIGGGVIGCEFACMMQPLGVEIDIVEMMPRLMPEMDAEVAELLAKEYEKRGIRIHAGAKVEKVELAGEGLALTLDGGKKLEADRVLLSIGRRAATSGIGLERLGIETERGFIPVDDHMRTSVPGVYCIGDANGRTLLAHAASAQAVVAVENALGHERPYEAVIPWCVYTYPELAGVGMTEARAAEQGIPIAVGRFPIGVLGKAMAVAHTDGFVKVIRDRRDDRLLGVHMAGHNVTEIIAAAACLMGVGATASQLAESVFAHPTLSEAVKEAAEDAYAAALHLPPAKMLRAAADLK